MCLPTLPRFFEMNDTVYVTDFLSNFRRQSSSFRNACGGSTPTFFAAAILPLSLLDFRDWRAGGRFRNSLATVRMPFRPYLIENAEIEKDSIGGGAFTNDVNTPKVDLVMEVTWILYCGSKQILDKVRRGSWNPNTFQTSFMNVPLNGGSGRVWLLFSLYGRCHRRASRQMLTGEGELRIRGLDKWRSLWRHLPNWPKTADWASLSVTVQIQQSQTSHMTIPVVCSNVFLNSNPPLDVRSSYGGYLLVLALHTWRLACLHCMPYRCCQILFCSAAECLA